MDARARFRSLLAELEPTPARWRRSARVGLITALGAGVTAAMQISNPLGLTLLFNFALPEAAFSPARGAAFIAAAALLQVLGLAVVGASVNSPIVHLTFFILLCLVTTYLIYAVPTLGRLWVWIQVPVVTAFYLAMFMPDGVGPNAAQAFAGMTIAIVLLLLCNGIVRPEPAEAVLADSITATLEHSRLRLAAVVGIIVGDASDNDDRPVASRLGHHLSLLGGALRSASSAARRVALLADLTIAEGIRDQIERINEAANAMRGRLPAEPVAEGLRALGRAIDCRLQRYIAFPGIAAVDAAPNSSVSGDEFGVHITRINADAPELMPITAAFARIVEFLEFDSIEWPPENDNNLPTDKLASPRPGVSANFLIRFSTRHTIALTVAFLIGLWDNNPALHAAIWLLMLGGPPSHGATARKFTIRAIGASSALALAALGTIIIAPDFTSPAPYMAAMFVGTMLMAYIGEGGGILSYLAIGGTAFVIAFGGPGPRPDVLGSIWSIWGISLGMIIRAVVSLLWRERASRTLAEQFQAPLGAVLAILKTDGGHARRRLTAVELQTVEGIATMLSVANDAMLEGRSAGIDAGRLVAALDTLRRVTFAIGNLMRSETLAPGKFKDALLTRVESWLESLREQTETGVPSRAPLRKMIADTAALEIHTSDYQRAVSVSDRPDLAAARHIARLMHRLEDQLAAVSLS
jgi:hypothetical protein